jgi:hypothetical protein
MQHNLRPRMIGRDVDCTRRLLVEAIRVRRSRHLIDLQELDMTNDPTGGGRRGQLLVDRRDVDDLPAEALLAHQTGGQLHAEESAP